MDLGFAAAEADGDWDDDGSSSAPEGELALVPLESASAPADNAAAAAAAAAAAGLPGAGEAASSSAPLALEDGPPKSKIHTNPRTRYFVIKSGNHNNLVLSIENKVWATQRQNEGKLNEALQTAPYVILIFSVNCSGAFQGYAKMVSPVGSSKAADVFRGFGGCFDVRWLRLENLDFSEVNDILNPWNENKSVKVSRDGQELPSDVGRRVCEMVDAKVYRSDPSEYVTDADEVETGGFLPMPGGLAGATPASASSEATPGSAAPVVAGGAPAPTGHAQVHPGGSPLPPCGHPPPQPAVGCAWGAPPHAWGAPPGHPQPPVAWPAPGAPQAYPAPWDYSPWTGCAGRRSPSYSSYSDYSDYSDYDYSDYSDDGAPGRPSRGRRAKASKPAGAAVGAGLSPAYLGAPPLPASLHHDWHSRDLTVQARAKPLAGPRA
eukprot:TRINITY_DN13035_c0_g1_i2.p1 TRINITY_DN13035_c0_g1~~TRINITY_DN13035_c0_g1_i2.p1  ORF type:complete len:434 (-),score=85.49 TRINITY_DN13035_c0_g1_i2:121-1422(-)